jgi:hypothetical protein
MSGAKASSRETAALLSKPLIGGTSFVTSHDISEKRCTVLASYLTYFAAISIIDERSTYVRTMGFSI